MEKVDSSAMEQAQFSKSPPSTMGRAGAQVVGVDGCAASMLMALKSSFKNVSKTYDHFNKCKKKSI